LDILAYTPRFLFNVFMTYTLDDTIRTTAYCHVARLRGKVFGYLKCYGNGIKYLGIGFGLKNWFLGGRFALKFMSMLNDRGWRYRSRDVILRSA